MHLRRELVELRVRIDEALRELARMRGRVADSLQGFDFIQQEKQLGKIRPGAVDRAAPGIDVLPEQRHFLRALRGKRRHLGEDVLERSRYLLAPRVGNDAEAAI